MKTYKQKHHKNNIERNINTHTIIQVGYNAQNEVLWEQTYIKNLLHSYQDFNVKNKTLQRIECFSRGDLVLTYTFHPNGCVHSAAGTKFGRKHGPKNKFDEFGNPTSIRNYKNGERHGRQKTYKPFSAQIISESVYKNGVLLSETTEKTLTRFIVNDLPKTR